MNHVPEQIRGLGDVHDKKYDTGDGNQNSASDNKVHQAFKSPDRARRMFAICV